MTAPDGLLVVDKPAGWTSHDVVARARRDHRRGTSPRSYSLAPTRPDDAEGPGPLPDRAPPSIGPKPRGQDLAMFRSTYCRMPRLR